MVVESKRGDLIDSHDPKGGQASACQGFENVILRPMLNCLTSVSLTPTVIEISTNQILIVFKLRLFLPSTSVMTFSLVSCRGVSPQSSVKACARRN